MSDFLLFVVCCLWLIPDGMNVRECIAFSTALNCLRQILPPRIIAIIILNGHS